MSSKHVRGARFRDPGGRLWRYSDRVLVRCPRCAGCATVIRPAAEGCRGAGETRLVCTGCGHAGRPKARCRDSGGAADPFFGLPLWLQAPCSGRTLWAYNAEHLAVLAGYVGAGVRERTSAPSAYTMVEILPLWMKLAKHRGEVLRVLDRLQRTLPPSSGFSR
jgi:hypothetical protein